MSAEINFEVDGAMPEVQPQLIWSIVQKSQGKSLGFELIDVRQPDEFTGELGHIPGAKLVTLGPDLMTYLKTLKPAEKVVFVCRSGGRSGQATMLARQMGLSRCLNLTGGMLRWNELGYQTS